MVLEVPFVSYGRSTSRRYGSQAGVGIFVARSVADLNFSGKKFCFSRFQFPDRSHETCGSPSGPPVLVVDDDDVGLYLLHVPCDNRVGITCSLPGNAVDVSTFFGYQTREVGAVVWGGEGMMSIYSDYGTRSEEV